MTEVERSIGNRFNLSIAMELTAIVRDDAFVTVIIPANESDHCPIRFLDCYRRNLTNLKASTFAFYQCDDVTMECRPLP